MDTACSAALPDAAEATVLFGGRPITIEEVVAIARDRAPVALDSDPEARARIDREVAFLDRLLLKDGEIYGVTTGYGDSCPTRIPAELVSELPLQLCRFHGCGLGAHLTPELTRAVLAVRLASLAKGHSGVRREVLQRLVDLLNLNVLPLIPEEGSVGASGDLTPLSYVAALLVGERGTLAHGAHRPAAEVLAELGVEPLTLRPKEGLAIMNGTAVMTGLACEAFVRAEYLTRLCARLTALASVALGGNPAHFDERLFVVKPHPGQGKIASWIRADLAILPTARFGERLQDRYSIRCAPHIIGVLRDSLPWIRQFIETELNSANDNPIIDVDEERVLHGGHFYGGHIAFAMDGLKTCVANLADLMDRQMALLVDTKMNNGLPSNLSGATGARAAINHGFKAVQIGLSAWTAEALKQTMPASVFSRSTECHNQDKVSMGTISARDALRVLQLTEQVAAGLVLGVVQAVELRGVPLAGPLAAFVAEIRRLSPRVEEDRPLEGELRATVAAIQLARFPLYV
jgi:histidine ammonia-lyase